MLCFIYSRFVSLLEITIPCFKLVCTLYMHEFPFPRFVSITFQNMYCYCSIHEGTEKKMCAFFCETLAYTFTTFDTKQWICCYRNYYAMGKNLFVRFLKTGKNVKFLWFFLVVDAIQSPEVIEIRFDIMCGSLAPNRIAYKYFFCTSSLLR